MDVCPEFTRNELFSTIVNILVLFARVLGVCLNVIEISSKLA